MSKVGAPRREVILSLAAPFASGVVVDVGCDHGEITAALGAVGTERRPNRLPRRRDVSLVVADGLRPFRSVDLAVITGMGPKKILEILSGGPRPAAAVVHTPQHSADLRVGLKEAGWRIDAERLAPEGGRFAEVLRILPGAEDASGYALRFGPRLLEIGDPLLLPHARQLWRHWLDLAERTPAEAPIRRDAEGWVGWLGAQIASWDSGTIGP